MRPRSQWQAASSDELLRGVSLGEYRIESKLGRGSMGTVYAAVHPLIEKRVAIKLLRRDLCARPEFVARFIQEARAINRIEHPNIVEVFGFGESASGIYLVMELLSGTSLGARVRAERLMVTEVCDIITEITYALEAAHEAGIVHRDLKPDNVFLATARGRTTVKLLDFGIAKLHDSALEGDTEPGTILGTPHYMAPEQGSGLVVDGRADIYALGVMVFEMLTGRLPFTASSALGVVNKHITDQAPDPSSFVSTLPEVADQLVAEMLQKDPNARPSLARVRELLDELREATFAVGTKPMNQLFVPSAAAATAKTAELAIDAEVEPDVEHEVETDDTAELVATMRRRHPIARLFGLAALLAGAGYLATLAL